MCEYRAADGALHTELRVVDGGVEGVSASSWNQLVKDLELPHNTPIPRRSEGIDVDLDRLLEEATAFGDAIRNLRFVTEAELERENQSVWLQRVLHWIHDQEYVFYIG